MGSVGGGSAFEAGAECHVGPFVCGGGLGGGVVYGEDGCEWPADEVAVFVSVSESESLGADSWLASSVYDVTVSGVVFGWVDVFVGVDPEACWFDWAPSVCE